MLRFIVCVLLLLSLYRMFSVRLYLSRWPIQASQADKFEAEVRKLRELLGELEFLRSRVDELRAENHLLLEAKQELEDQLASRDRDMTSLVELDKELSRYQQLLQRSTEVAYRARWFYIDWSKKSDNPVLFLR